MRVSVCVGDYASVPFCMPGLNINVYCIEELCCCIRENAFLIDFSLMSDELLKWLDKECGLQELAKALHPLVHRHGSLSAFAATILNYAGFFDDGTVAEVERVLKQGAGLSVIEKKKSQIDYLVKKKKFAAAIRQYDRLIELWQEQESQGEILPAKDCLAAVWHNKGVAFAQMMIYKQAAESFHMAYEISRAEEYYKDYLAAKRMELPERDYVAFAAEHQGNYELTLRVEKELELLIREWESMPEYFRLNRMREMRCGGDRQNYYEECEQLTQAFKSSYRSSVSD